MDINYYRLAPTHLYHKELPSRVFKTQEEVDQAWRDGWYGPPWLAQETSLLSSEEFSSKAELLAAVHSDPRYRGAKANRNMNLDDIRASLREWEASWDNDDDGDDE